MVNPIKVDLYLKQQSSCNLYSTNVGGDPTKLIKILNNKKYKYLEGIYSTKSSNFQSKNNVCFEFDDGVNGREDIVGSRYLGKGGLTSVFGLKYLTNNFMPELASKKLILRAMDLYEAKDMNKWITKYNENKRLFGSNIIDIYMYGDLYSSSNRFISSYVITRFYQDHTAISNLGYSQLVNYFKSILEFFVKLEDLEYFYRDLKFTNIGMDIDNTSETNKFVVLDYDDITIINKDNDFFGEFNLQGCYTKYCAGTLIPYFIIKDYLELNPQWINKFDKVHVIGLVDIMINLFFVKEKNSINILKIIYKPCDYDTCIHYYQYLKIFDDKNTYDILEHSLISLKSKFVELEHSKKDCLIYLVMNLLNKKYSHINSAKIILDEFVSSIINKKSVIIGPNGKYVDIDDIIFTPITKSISPPTNKLNKVGGKIFKS
jgi:hypothetical protein